MLKLTPKLSALMWLALVHCGGTDNAPANNPDAIRGTALPTTTFVVRIENVSGGSLSIPLSPGAYAIHAQDNPLFLPNAPADAGIERIAEDGAEQTELKELLDQDGVKESGQFAIPVGTTGRASIFPGEAYEFSVRALPGESLSFATMFVESNDLFFAPRGSGIRLFDSAGSPLTGDMTSQTLLWDAGTEVNEEPGVGPNQAPRQSSSDAGTPENGVVQPLTSVNDGYQYPAVADVIRVTVRLRN